MDFKYRIALLLVFEVFYIIFEVTFYSSVVLTCIYSLNSVLLLPCVVLFYFRCAAIGCNKITTSYMIAKVQSLFKHTLM